MVRLRPGAKGFAVGECDTDSWGGWPTEQSVIWSIVRSVCAQGHHAVLVNILVKFWFAP